MEKSSGGNNATPEPDATGWRKYGCFIPLALAVPVWLILFPESSYYRALDFVLDTLATVVFIVIAALSGQGIMRSPRTVRPLGYLSAVVFLGLAALCGWNLVAVYGGAGIEAVTLFGWWPSGRPSICVLVLLVVLFLATAVSKWLGKGKQPNECVRDETNHK